MWGGREIAHLLSDFFKYVVFLYIMAQHLPVIFIEDSHEVISILGGFKM